MDLLSYYYFCFGDVEKSSVSWKKSLQSSTPFNSEQENGQDNFGESDFISEDFPPVLDGPLRGLLLIFVLVLKS